MLAQLLSQLPHLSCLSFGYGHQGMKIAVACDDYDPDTTEEKGVLQALQEHKT